MPIYTYQCTVCRNAADKLKSIATRDDCAPCEECGGDTQRVEVAVPGLLKPNGGFQFGLIRSNGEVIPGHAGREAPRKRKK